MKKILMIVAMLVFILSTIHADEGMFLLNQIPIQKIKKLGLKLELKDIYNPNGLDISDAVVNVDGGSGAFVSPDGLIITNHHVAFAAIQRSSSPSHDYIKNGFYAKKLSQEIQAKGYDAKITLGFVDVTKDVLAGTTLDMDPVKRLDKIEKNIKEIEKAVKEKEKIDKTRIVPMFSGKVYYLFKYKVIKDIRIVYAPPSSIGSYGGNIDNWMWPRHSGDFTFLRAYVSPEGKGVKYSKNNVPYHPKKYVRISLDGVKEGDITFIMGYPGRTMRYRSSYSVNFYERYVYPINIALFGAVINTWESITKKDRKAYIKYAFKLAMLNNVYKNYQGMKEGFRKLKLLDKKIAVEDDILQFIKKHPVLVKEYGNVIKSIGKLYTELGKEERRNTIFKFLKYNVLVFKNALKLYEWNIEKAKDEKDRKRGYSNEDIKKLKKKSKRDYKNVLVYVDKKVMKLLLNEFLNLPENEQFEVVKNIYKGKKTVEEKKKAINDFVENFYKNTLIKNHKNFLEMLDLPKGKLPQDSAITFVKGFYDYIKKIDKTYKKFNGSITKLRPKYIEMIAIYKKYKNQKVLPGLKVMKEAVKKLYPDANFTIRFTYGTVKGYSPRDAVTYHYITGFGGILEKDTGKEPFNAPEKFYQIYDATKYIDPAIGDVPVNFTHTTDITGGNSGSPVFNAKGEYIGIAFDGNYEAMTSDWQFSNKLTRSISCDARYIIFLLDKFSNAKNLLKELGF